MSQKLLSLLVFSGVFSLTALYLLPGILAVMRRRPQGGWIFLVNLVFGWTVIGWIATLLWANGKKLTPPRKIPMSRETPVFRKAPVPRKAAPATTGPARPRRPTVSPDPDPRPDVPSVRATSSWDIEDERQDAYATWLNSQLRDRGDGRRGG